MVTVLLILLAVCIGLVLPLLLVLLLVPAFSGLQIAILMTTDRL